MAVEVAVVLSPVVSIDGLLGVVVVGHHEAVASGIVNFGLDHGGLVNLGHWRQALGFEVHGVFLLSNQLSSLGHDFPADPEGFFVSDLWVEGRIEDGLHELSSVAAGQNAGIGHRVG